MKKILFFLPLLFLLSFLSHKNQGFRPSKIFFPQDWVFASDLKESTRIDGKTFKYLSKGRQCFVFESEDEKYVLKFLRFDKLQDPLWTQIPTAFYAKDKKIQYKDKKRLAWKDCFSKVKALPIDLGIISSQLSPNLGNVTLKDEIGRSHKISLENTRFFLQKKVTPLNVALSQEKNPQQIVKVFLISVLERINQNILNKSQSCMENVGWTEGKIVEFDFGEIVLEDKIENKKEKFLFFTQPMRQWLFVKMPKLVKYFDKTRDEIAKDIYD